jgi:uncharacterized protein
MAIFDVRAQIGTTPIWGAPFSDAHLLRTMQKYGIEQSIVSSTLAGTCDVARGNAQLFQAIKDKPSLYGCITVNVHYTQESIVEMRRYLNKPNFAAMAIFSGEQGRSVTLDESEDILNAYRRYRRPVLIRTESRADVLAANEIAKAFPGVKVVLLSMGGDSWRNAAACAHKTLNIVLEISGSHNTDKIKHCAELIGAHRMVYGSDLPFADPAVTIGVVEDSDISDSDKQMIFSGTAGRVFRPPTEDLDEEEPQIGARPSRR